MDAVSTEYHEVEASIRAVSPRYAALIRPQPLTLTEIQRQVLDKDSLLLEYSLGEEASFLFVVSQDSIAGYPQSAGSLNNGCSPARSVLICIYPNSSLDASLRSRHCCLEFWH
jgi:hypothetical protein